MGRTESSEDQPERQIRFDLFDGLDLEVHVTRLSPSDHRHVSESITGTAAVRQKTTHFTSGSLPVRFLIS